MSAVAEQESKLTDEQKAELSRLKQFYPFRIVYGVVDKNSGVFSLFASYTRRGMMKAVRDGHAVFLI
jgi:hypothetical protein